MGISANLLAPKEFAQLVGIDVELVYKLADEGRIPSCFVKGKLMILPAALKRFLMPNRFYYKDDRR